MMIILMMFIKHLKILEIKIRIKNKINSINYLFYYCTNLFGIIGYFNVSGVINFQALFKNCFSLSNINSLKDWNVSNGNNFDSMFSNCYSLNSIDALRNWNVSNGYKFGLMFYNCYSLNNIDGLDN